MAPGAISMATTRMMPTALSEATMVSDSSDQQAVVQRANRQADGARMLRIEAVEQQVAPLDEHDEQRAAGDDRRSRPDRAR